METGAVSNSGNKGWPKKESTRPPAIVQLAPMRKPPPPLDTIKPDTPLRLHVAAALAFPDGSMTENSLRKATTQGRLMHERLQGKIYTTLAWIADWRAACRVQPKASGSGSVPKSETRTARSGNARSGSSATAEAKSARAALQKIAKAPTRRSASTSSTSTSPTEGANVIQLRS